MRLDTNWQWYRRDGSWNYEAVTSSRRKSRTGTARRRRRRAGQDRGQGRLGPLSPRGQHRPTARGPSSPASSSTPAGTPTRRTPTAPRCSTSPSTSQPTSRARPRKLRIAIDAWRQRARSPCCGAGLDLHAGGRVANGRRRGADPRQRRLGPRRLRHGACSTGRMDEKAKRMPSRAIGLQVAAPSTRRPRTLKVAPRRCRRR